MKIIVPVPELFQRSAALKEQAQLVRTTINNIDTTVKSLEFMGKSATKFFNEWDAAMPQMRNWADIVDAFADDMHDQAKRMEPL